MACAGAARYRHPKTTSRTPPHACGECQLGEGHPMNRRALLSLLAGAAIAPVLPRGRTASAQPAAKILRIGTIDEAPMWQSFRHGLRQQGYVEGQSIAYEYRYSEGVPERLETIVGELIRRPVDLIATFGTQTTQAAKAATTAIPIVMVGVGDPVRSGLVASLARPGGNITGNTVLSPDLGPKRLEVLRDAG